MLDTLDAAAIRRWCGGGLAALRAHQHEIDELNVYPVPDGDTGTNLVLTLASAQQALTLDLDTAGESGAGDGAQTPLGHALRLMARGALLGARGNSGVIVSQILRGMADALASTAAVRGGDLAHALRSATEAAYAAVAKPVEGTVLSVVAAAAEAAGRIGSDDLLAVARAASHAASHALALTPRQLPALARAGVVDAGGRGLCLLLDALVEALGGEPAVSGQPSAVPLPSPTAVAPPAPAPRGHSGHSCQTPSHGHAGEAPADGQGDGASADGQPDSGGAHDFEVQYLLDAVAEALPPLRDALAAFGDSLVVVGTGDGDPPTWNVHVHVHVGDIGPAIEAGVVAGRPHRISVTPLPPVDGGRPAAPQLTAAVRPDDRTGHRRDDVTAREGSHPTGDGDVTGRGSDPTGDGDPTGRGGEPAGSGDPTRRGSALYRVAPGEQLAAAEPGGPLVQGPLDMRERLRPADAPAVDPRARAAVVVAAGDGLTALFTTEGATVVGRNPSTAEVLDAVRSTAAGRVVLLPNDANTHAVAVSAAREAASVGIRVSVVPTRSPVQALAALAVRDPERAFSDDVIAMAEAAGACRYGEVCTASREALTVAGRCRPGDLLGLLDGEVHVIGSDLDEVCRRLLDRMLGGGGELATAVLGADAPADLEETLREHVRRTWPFVELQCFAGGQPRYHLLLGVE